MEKDSWRRYFTTRNHNTNTTEIWNKIKAMKGKTPTTAPKIQGTNTNMEVAEKLAQHFAKSSSDKNHKDEFLQQKSTLEKEFPHIFKD